MATREIEKTPEEWRAELGPEQYEVLRTGAPSRVHGEVLGLSRRRHLPVCGMRAPSCSTNTKFESGAGWPTSPSRSSPMRLRTNTGPQIRDDPRRWLYAALIRAPGSRLRRRARARTAYRYDMNSCSLDLDAR